MRLQEIQCWLKSSGTSATSWFLHPASPSASGHLESLRNAEEGSVGVALPSGGTAPPSEAWKWNGAGILNLAVEGAFLVVFGGWHLEDFEIEGSENGFRPFVEKSIHFGYMFNFSLSTCFSCLFYLAGLNPCTIVGGWGMAG